MQNLQRHPTSGVWRVRKQVPSDLRKAVGKREIIVSTGTKDHSLAKVKALPIMADIEATLAKLRNPAIDLTGMAQTFLGQLRPDAQAQQQIDLGIPFRPFRDQAGLDQALIDYAGKSEIKLTGDNFAGLRRAVQEWAWMSLDRRSPHIPGMAAPTQIDTTADPSPTLTRLYEKYVGEAKPLADTQAQHQVVIRKFIAQFGDLQIAEITKAQAIKFKDALVGQPGRSGQTLKPSTINKSLGYMVTILGYAANNKMITINPFSGVEAAGETKSERVPFDPEDLTKLFGPLLDDQSPLIRYLGLIGLFMGARINEIAQLWRGDVLVREGVQCVRFSHNRHPDQRVKTRTERIVPIHPKVIELGFLDFVRTIPEDASLFSIRRAGATTRWATYSDKCGVIDPDKVHHSLRHNFTDGCRAAGVEEAVQDRITGHNSPKMGRRYGKGYTLPVLLGELSKVKFEGFPR
jgi:integrase